MKSNRYILILLIVMNLMVLLGQLWPEGAPPFARFVNIIFLILSLVYFIFLSLPKNIKYQLFQLLKLRNT